MDREGWIVADGSIMEGRRRPLCFVMVMMSEL